MSKILPVFLILVSFLFSASVLTSFNLGVMFDLSLVIMICYGFFKGEVKGAIFGFVVGFVYGILMANIVGFFAFLGFATGFVSGIFRENDQDRSLIITILIVLAIVFSYQTVSYLGQSVLFGQFGFLQRFHTVVLPKTILTTALFIPVYLFVSFVRNKVKRVELA